MCFRPRGGRRPRVAIHIVLGSPAGLSVFQEPSLLPGGLVRMPHLLSGASQVCGPHDWGETSLKRERGGIICVSGLSLGPSLGLRASLESRDRYQMAEVSRN